MHKTDYSYDRFGSKGSRVGQAVVDILSKPQPVYSAEEILDEMGKGIMSYIFDAVEKGVEKYKSKFYLLHLFNKTLGQFNVDNVVVQKAMAFKDRKWTPKEVMDAHPNPCKTLYEVDPQGGLVKMCWTLPAYQDCKSIMKNPALYDADLIKWIGEALPPPAKST